MRRFILIVAITGFGLFGVSGCGLQTPADRNEEVVDRLDKIIRLLEERE